MSKYGNSYSGNDFLEWWKTHYGTDYDGTSNISKTENMTDEDFAIGQTLLSNYQKAQKIESDFQESSNKLLENYTAAKDTFDKNKRQSQQNASITLDKLKKYLPMQIKAQGLGGLGVSESSMLQAYNNYSRDMGAIESEHAQKMSDLERAYGENVGNLESEKNNLLYYADKDENGNLLVNNTLNEYSEKRDNEHATNYKTALEAIRRATDATVEEMNAFVEQYRGKVSDEQLRALFREGANVAQAARDENAYIVAQATVEELIADGKFDEAKSFLENNKTILGDDAYTAYMTTVDSKVQQKQQDDQEAATKEYDQRVVEGKEFINYGGKEYKILEKLDKNSNEITNNDSFTEKLNALGYTNPYDKNIPNGTTIYINRDSTGSDKVTFWDFVPFVHAKHISRTGSHNWHLTYYNGEWYHSEEQ